MTQENKATAVDVAAYAELRAKAEAATSGPWIAIHSLGVHEVREVDNDPTNKHHWPFRIAHTVPGQTAKIDTANFDYLAAVDPQTILTLLNELEALRAALIEARRYVAYLAGDDRTFVDPGMPADCLAQIDAVLAEKGVMP